MPRRTIAIGDIHGCAAALHAVLDAIQPLPSDTIITLGDYIDRGLETRAVVERLLALGDQCEFIPLIGNHELMFLSAREDEQAAMFWKECGGAETLGSYGGEFSSIPSSHVEFIESCTLAYETDTHIFVHANYEASRPLDEQDDHRLLWQHLTLGIPDPHISGKTVVVGHTPQVSGEILDLGHLICLDTYCFGNGWLTAMELETRTIWQADKLGVLRES